MERGHVGEKGEKEDCIGTQGTVMGSQEQLTGRDLSSRFLKNTQTAAAGKVAWEVRAGGGRSDTALNWDGG